LTGFTGAKNLSASLVQPLVSPRFPLLAGYASKFPLSLHNFSLSLDTASKHLWKLFGNEISPNTHRFSRFYRRNLKAKRFNEQDYPKQTRVKVKVANTLSTRFSTVTQPKKVTKKTFLDEDSLN